MTTVDDRPRIVEFPALKEAQGKLAAKRDQLAAVLTEAGPNYDMSQVKSLQGDSKAKVEQLQAWNAEIDDLKKAVDEHLVVAKAAWEAKEYGAARESGTHRDDEGPQVKGGRRKSFGAMVAESPAIKGFKAGSSSGPTARIDVEVKTLFSTSAGWDPEDTRTGRLTEYPTRPIRVIDVFPQTTTGQSTVKYMEETVFVNNAAEVAEGGAFPEVQLKVEEKTSEVRKIPAFLPVTEETFEDEPRAQSYVENRLPSMLRQRIDLQLLVGNGTAPNLRGLENVSGIQTQALGADPIPDAIYKAMRKIRDDGFSEPSHCFIRPEKWETVRLMRTADGLYIWGHPSMVGPVTIWGVPVIETTACTSTKADIGDFTNHAEVAMRRGIDIQISNSHGNYFTEGILAVRADVRLAVIYYRPKAFATVTGL